MPLKPAVSASARRTMQSAFNEIENNITPDDSHGFSTITLEDVRKAALVIENQMAARQALRSMRRLMPLFRGMAHYANVVEILCNGTPYLSWIWAPITLILKIASEYVEAFEQVIKGYSKIAESLKRFATLNKALANDMDFQQTLAVYYADILLYHKNAYQFVRRNGWKLLFLTSWGRFQRRFDNLLEDMKRHGELIDLQANASHIAEAREMREEIKAWREDSLYNIRQLNDQESTKQYESIIAWFKIDESDQSRILDIISSESSKTTGTCSWALKNLKISSWLQSSPDLPILWLNGKPGSGKSVLLSEVIKFMRASNQLIIRHFCSQRYASSTLYHEILRSLLLQLLRNHNELVAHVYKDHVFGRKPPTVQALEKLLLSLLKVMSSEPRHIKYVWIILDGLNECEPSQQTSIIGFLNQLSGKTASSGDTVCKVLISSRYSNTIAKRLRASQTISLSDEPRSLKLAIMQYVSQRLQLLHDKFQQLGLAQKDVEGLARVITNKADGMFLYARLVLDYLATNIFYDGAEIKSSIDALPEELSDFYQKILTQILIQLDARSVERLRSIFGWIAFSKRPLKRMEFLSALTFASGPSKDDRTSLVPRYVLDVCGPLVEERPDTSLTFIHLSVKEFLQSSKNNFRITYEEAVIEHCISTITCLLFGFEHLVNQGRQAGALGMIKGFHGLHVYATEFWTENLLNCASLGKLNSSEALLELANALVNKLEKYSSSVPEENTLLDNVSLDIRLAYLEQYPLLAKHVGASLKSRSLKRLELSILREAQGSKTISPQHPVDMDVLNSVQSLEGLPSSSTKDMISEMLISYQDTAAFLLQQDQYPGVSSAELELWKSQFRTSAFTCRLGFCPRASEGFPSEDLRRQHEMAHTQLAICTIPDCKYPPFQSARALKSHISKCHFHKPARRPIRVSRIDHENSTGPKAALHARRLVDSTDKGIVDRSSNVTNKKKSLEQHEDKEQSMFESETGSEVPVLWKGVTRGILTDISAFPKIETMRYRACTIQDCSEELGEAGSSENWTLHYWTWHHADSIARCADYKCQMIFANRRCLEAHYLQNHTAIFCTLCRGHDSEGFRHEEDLKHHWIMTHIQKVKQWACDDPYRKVNGILRDVVSAITFDSCPSCTGGQKYERQFDAVRHLMKVHFQQEFDDQNSNTQRYIDALRPFAVDVWVYEIDQPVEPHKSAKSETQTWLEIESDEEETFDDMFYVPELA
ncbi:hypothetical protein GGS24DRAFT_515180 [Hypoxylon argillaceum]|nr:hypothetical protein GGS24DRAFT_515180 [Hypoxylon argillaceum]